MTVTPHVLPVPAPTAPAARQSGPSPALASTSGKPGRRGQRVPTERTWRRLSAAFTRQVPGLIGPRDLTVTMAPGAGRGSPGCYLPHEATIELDPETLTAAGVPPTTCRPNRPADRERYPATWGVFVHECAHARHSRWIAAESLPSISTSAPATEPAAAQGPTPVRPPRPATVAAATLLEEARVEAKHLARRPGDRRWLRAAVTSLVLPDIKAIDPGAGTPISPWQAGQAAGLVLARVDAGVLDETEAQPIEALVARVLGHGRLGKLRDIWRGSHNVADDNATAMLDLGRAWCAVLGVEPEQGEPDHLVPVGRRPGAQDGAPSPLQEAIQAVLGAVGKADGAEVSDGVEQALAARAAERAAEQDVRRAARRAAASVFRNDVRPGPTRTPTETESIAARRLARTLRDAGTRDRVTITQTSATPPGRLSMRGALAADAQRAAGAMPTAEPFTRTIRRNVPTPPLRVGIACDVSGSMHEVTPAIASTAWIVNSAVRYVPDARAAAVTFGHSVRAITRPGQIPGAVRILDARDRFERFTQAVDALDGALDLTRRDAARLLVIVSDGRYKDHEPVTGQRRIDRLRASGCGVLWITLNSGLPPRPMNGARVLTLTDPAGAPDAIARAVADTLRRA